MGQSPLRNTQIPYTMSSARAPTAALAMALTSLGGVLMNSYDVVMFSCAGVVAACLYMLLNQEQDDAVAKFNHQEGYVQANDCEAPTRPAAMDRRQMLQNAAAFAATAAAPMVASAEVDYDGVKYLGGGEKVDINNANIRAYAKIPGMYPNIGGLIVSNGPYKSVGDLYKIPGMTEQMKETLKKNESKFIVLEPNPTYVIDKINNGLYR